MGSKHRQNVVIGRHSVTATVAVPATGDAANDLGLFRVVIPIGRHARGLNRNCEVAHSPDVADLVVWRTTEFAESGYASDAA